jgi:hypothetical protein
MMVERRGSCDLSDVSPGRRIPRYCIPSMHDARQAVAAMRGRIAMNSVTSPLFSDRVEGHARMYATITAVACDEACCNRRSTEHACRAYDVSH